MTLLELSFVIVLALSLLGLTLILHLAFRSLSQLNERSRETILTLTKLAASKDIAAFHGLESAPGPYESNYPQLVPMDDESIARSMMERYAQQGIDPNFALSPDSDPLEEFGGKEAFN